MKVDEKNRDVSGIGPRVKEIRLALKMKQAEFSSVIDISIPTLSSIETSKGNLTLDQYVKIVKEFDVNPDYLLFGKSPMFRNPSNNTYFYDLDNLDIKPELMEKFLYYFKNSSIMQLAVITEFKRKLVTDTGVMDQEIAKRLKGEK
jgi:transcriptional regulator with XRE-family HTH domain